MINYWIKYDKAANGWLLCLTGQSERIPFASQVAAKQAAVAMRAEAGGAGNITVLGKDGKISKLSC